MLEPLAQLKTAGEGHLRKWPLEEDEEEPLNESEIEGSCSSKRDFSVCFRNDSLTYKQPSLGTVYSST